MNTIRKYLASHKGTLTSIVGAVVTSASAALYQGVQNGKLDTKAVGLAALSGLFGLLAGLGKSPSTPKQDPPAGGSSNA